MREIGFLESPSLKEILEQQRLLLEIQKLLVEVVLHPPIIYKEEEK